MPDEARRLAGQRANATMRERYTEEERREMAEERGRLGFKAVLEKYGEDGLSEMRSNPEYSRRGGYATWEGVSEEERSARMREVQASITPEQRRKNSKKGARKRHDKTPEEKAEISRKISEAAKRRWANYSEEERREIGRRSTAWQNDLSAEERSERARKAGLQTERSKRAHGGAG